MAILLGKFSVMQRKILQMTNLAEQMTPFYVHLLDRIQVKLSELFQFSFYFKKISGLLLKPESGDWKMISTNAELSAVDDL
jgi:hypothetical protein